MHTEVRDQATAARPRRFTGILMAGALVAGSAAAGTLAAGRAPAPVVFAAPAASTAGHVEGSYADVVARVALAAARSAADRRGRRATARWSATSTTRTSAAPGR